ncbi:MAG TPA: GNAT family N-acetyltransferase [Acidimicrobiales bacterium]|jgi:GNAT superfamily N-acetyltransferase|nr:GNAT family N-acetyltransferase [Acidimicrobiales bacterium]
MELARPATDADRGPCLLLLEHALAHAVSMRGGPALVGEATAEGLFGRWSHRKGPSRLLVGEYEGAVVGMLAVAARGDGERRRGRIDCCYVEEDARGVGVGSALMEAAVGWCDEAGCAEVDALALPGDRATKQRLEAAGFTARLLTLSRRLG